MATTRTLAPLVVALLFAPQIAPAQQRVLRTAPLDPDGFVRIQNLVGSVRIIGWDRDSVSVTGTVASGGSSLHMAGSGKGIKVGVDWPIDQAEPGPSSLEVRVPARSHVWVKAASADVEVSGFSGGLDLSTVTGRIRVTGAPREVHAESMGGDVEIDVTGSLVRARSASGSISLRGGAADADLSTVSGNIAAAGGPYQRGRFESVDGRIHFEGDFASGGALEFINHSGPIELRLPGSVSADFTLSTFHGAVRNALGGPAPRPRPDLRGREVTFSKGGGGAHVSIRNFKGEIVLSYR